MSKRMVKVGFKRYWREHQNDAPLRGMGRKTRRQIVLGWYRAESPVRVVDR